MTRQAAFALALAAGFATYSALAFRFAADGGGAWPDDAIYRYQAKTLAIGHVAVPEPPEPSAFRVPAITSHQGRWFGKYYPGFPALLAVGELLGAPWLVNPLLAGVLVFGTFLLGRVLVSPGVGLAAALFLALSPLFRNLSTVYLSHVPCSAGALLAALVLVHARRTGSIRLGLLAGAFWGVALTTRPLSALCFLVPFGVVAVRDLRVRRSRWVAGAACAVTASLVGVLAWNAMITGDPLASAYSIANPRDSLGFDAPTTERAGRRATYTPAAALESLQAQVRSAASTVFPVPLPGPAALLLAAPFLAVFRRRGRGPAFLLALSTLLLMAAHFLYPGTRGVSATAFGPRYYSEALPAYFLLLALAVAPLGERTRAAARTGRGVLVVVAVAAVVVSFHSHWERTRRLHADRLVGQNERLAAFLRTLPPGRRIVFVDISTYNEKSAMLANRPDLDQPDLVAIYRQPDQNRAVLAAYPGREAILLRWNAKADAPDSAPYVPEADLQGPPRSFPYVGPRGTRFPPPGARPGDGGNDGADPARSGR